MAALTLQDETLVWQKVSQVTSRRNPATQNAFRALKTYFAGQKLAPQLQFVPFGPADVDAATGFSLPTGACTLYAVFGYKSGTGTTKAFLDVHNKNTITGSTDVISSLMFSGPGDERFEIFPNGIPITSTTGANLGSVTTIGGSTPTTGDSDSQSGFLILGA